MRYTRLLLLTSLLLSFSLVACGSPAANEAETVGYTIVQEAAADISSPPPSPSTSPILTIAGQINNPNQGDELVLDRDTLESLDLVEMTVFDEQAEGDTHTFQGVLLADVLQWAAISPDATQLFITALDGYRVNIPLVDVENYPILLATRVDNEHLTLDRFGPTRIVYPYHAFEMDWVVYNPRWIWNIEHITVE